MSTVKINNVQIGQSVTATNNFTWYQPASPDGTVRLGNGNSGSVSDVITVGTTGNLTFANSVSLSAASTKTLTLNGGAGSNGLVLDANNNVGIGVTPSGSYKLEAAGSVKFGSTSTPTALYCYSTADWNFSGLDLIRVSSNVASPRCIGFPLDGDSLSSTTVGGYNAIWGIYSSAPTSGSTSSSLNAKMGLASYAGFNYYINGTQAMTLDASGNLGIGTTSPAVRLHVDAGSSGEIQRYNTSSTAPFVGWYVSGTRKAYQQWDASYGWILDSEAASTGIVFRTQNTERARIDSSGRLLINQTAASAANAGTKFQSATDNLATGSLAGWFFENRSGGVTSTTNWYGWYGSGGLVYFYNGGGNAASINPSTGVYTPLSDKNKKKDFEPSAIGLDVVLALKPTLFRMKDAEDGSPKELGFIAQDVKDVIPQAYVEHIATDAGGKESTYIGLNDRPIIAALVKAIQELSAELNELKQKVNA